MESMKSEAPSTAIVESKNMKRRRQLMKRVKSIAKPLRRFPKLKMTSSTKLASMERSKRGVSKPRRRTQKKKLIKLPIITIKF